MLREPAHRRNRLIHGIGILKFRIARTQFRIKRTQLVSRCGHIMIHRDTLPSQTLQTAFANESDVQTSESAAVSSESNERNLF